MDVWRLNKRILMNHKSWITNEGVESLRKAGERTATYATERDARHEKIKWK